MAFPPHAPALISRTAKILALFVSLLLLPSCTVTSLHSAPPRASRQVSPYDVIDQYAQVLTIVENTYVQPVKRNRLLEGSIRGLVSELDPHSAFMDPERFHAFEQETKGEFVGIGVEVDLRDGILRVLAPIEGSPAQRAGIRPGDVILAVDDWPAQGEPLERVVEHIRGKPGTHVRLLVRRKGFDKLLSFDLERKDIHVPSVKSQILLNDVAYLTIRQFQDGTHAEFLDALQRLRTKTTSGHLQGLILDLRTNPGGLVRQAALVADEFLSQGIIYSTRSRWGEVQRVVADGSGAVRTVPTVVLVNALTASAAELLAASLQGNGRAKIVGTRTYGKGSVQSILALPAGSGLKLTTMLYYDPLGRPIQARGVEPDIEVQPEAKDRETSMPLQREEDIEGHLLPEEETTNTSRQARPTPRAADIVLPRGKVPIDPRKGKDEALKVAYEQVLRMIAGGRNSP